MRSSATTRSVLALALCIVAVLAALHGCATDPETVADSVGEATPPAEWNLSTPETAVRSYLDWVSFSYRMANSEIPTATMTPGESVRVDSYIQLNRMDGKGIEQSLALFEVVSVTEDAEQAVLVAREKWQYRYFSLETLGYVSEPLSATYDTTYTLVGGPGRWLVDRVEASASGEVQ